MSERYYILSTKYSLQERQTKRGKVYDVVFRVVDLSGNTKQKNLCGYSTKTLAKQAYTDFVTEHCELVKNFNVKRRKDTNKEIPLVIDLIKEYISTLFNQNKESSILDKQRMYDLYIIPKLGNEKITALDKLYLKKWQDETWSMRMPKTGKPYSYKYLLNIRINLSAFLTWVEETYGYKNYLKEIKKPKNIQPKKQMQIWTREEFEQFISVVDNPLYHCLFTMMFFTGRRKGEIIALQAENVKRDKIIFDRTYSRKTLERNSYTITATKNMKIGITPICDTLKKELKNYKGDAPFFFGGDKPIHENSISNNFKRYCKIAKVKEIRLHDLRHSFVSMCIHLGATVPVVADLIGDTQQQVMKTYSHLYESDKNAIIKRLN